MFANSEREIQVAADPAAIQAVPKIEGVFSLAEFFGSMGLPYGSQKEGWISVGQLKLIQNLLKIVIESNAASRV